MKVITGKFMTWLMSLTRIMRYFVIALLLHVLLLAILGSIKIVAMLPPLIRGDLIGGLAPAKNEEPDPNLPYRPFDYKGPALGDGGGTRGQGPGGTPTAAGSTPSEYRAGILQSEARIQDATVGPVIDVVDPGATEVARVSVGAGGLTAPTTGLGTGSFVMPGVQGPGGNPFGHRAGAERGQLEDRFRSSKEAGKAVLAGLRWLQQHQRPDGSWECKGSDSAGTALAVLAFLGHGETPDSEEFGPTVNKGLANLVSRIGPDGIVTDKNMYAQGAVTLALSEAFGMTRSAAVKEPLERAIKVIIAIQQVPKSNSKHVGGWRYTPTSNDADTSVSGWMIMALKSAKLAGIAVPDETFALATQYLWHMYGTAGFGYTAPGQAPNMTAVGVLCHQFLGQSDEKRIKKALDYLREQKVDWSEGQGFALYGWYYMTQAMFQGGGGYWEYWNKQIRDTMVKNQAADGRWDPPPQSKENQGPVYSTALGCLILEVYYRYLPIYQEVEKRPTPPAFPALQQAG